MKRSAFAKASLASLMVATTMVGCTGAAFHPSASVQQDQNPERLAAAAEKALADRNGARAVESAEAAVRADPRNARYRQLLGRAYVASGRLASAETALADAMTLGNSDARTIVSLALVQVGLGKDDAARALLAANSDHVPAGDYGLAMAMAGDPQEGVRILSLAIHDPSATARTRQNLAYAYALDGRWKDARMMAGLDLDPLAANQRITSWAQTAAPGMAPQRIAALMGITIDSGDLGQPTALALAPAPDAAPAQMAEAAPAPAPEALPEAPVQTAEVEPAFAPVTGAGAVSLPRTQGPVPALRVSIAPVRLARRATPPLRATPAPRATQRLVASARLQQAAYHLAAAGNSNWVVQLGAYDSAGIAREKWFAMARRNSALAGYPVLTSQISINGANFHRLAVSGFASRDDANALCRTIRARKGQCFVREKQPDSAPQRWALAVRGRQVATR